MIKLENHEIIGWEHAIRGMRNPLNSWNKGDSQWLFCSSNDEQVRVQESDETAFFVGPNDLDLMTRLRNAGTDHRKFMRMIVVYVDITAPLYWWKEFDTYKVGTVANSCSTMHKIADKEFTLEDFSHEYLIDGVFDHYMRNRRDPLGRLKETIDELNFWRTCYNGTNKEVGNAEIINAKTGEPFTKKDFWWQMIQLLPSSYNQKRTVMLNYEVLTNMYAARKNHKLDEWHDFCEWVEGLPLSELIVRKEEEKPDPSKIPIANEIMEEAKRRVYAEIEKRYEMIIEQLANCNPEYAFTEEELKKILDTEYPDSRAAVDNEFFAVDNEFFTGLHRYEINYGYGIAILDTPYDPKERFYTLARTCFGIRKSISACTIISDTELPVTGFERLEFNGDCYIWRKDGARRMLSPNADDEWDTSFCERCRYV